MEIYVDGGVRRWTKQEKVVSGSAFAVFQEGVEVFHQKRAWEFKTNNQMELSAMYMAMKYALDNNLPVSEYVSDSKYVIRGLTEWCHGWQLYGWMTKEGSPVKNRELWEALWTLYNFLGKPKVSHTKGHADNEFNNRADELVNLVMDEKEIALYGDTYKNMVKEGRV